MTDTLIQISSYIPASQTEFVDGFLFENAPSNWVLEINHITGEGQLKGFFSSDSEMHLQRSAIINEIGHLAEFKFSTCLIENQDWKESYKIHFSPWKYKGVHFVPIWLRDIYKVPKNEISLLLDPGMAFGTGNHESTRMCLEFLIENNKSNEPCPNSMLDLGCGSGILAITGYSLGFKYVIGLDNDLDAVRISKENAILNNISNKVSFKCEDLINLDVSIGKFDYVVANIQADILTKSAKQIIEHSNENSKIILSGILTREMDQILEVFAQEMSNENLDYCLKQQGEWSAIQIIKSAKE